MSKFDDCDENNKSIIDQFKIGLIKALKEQLEQSETEEEAERILAHFNTLDLSSMFSELLEEYASKKVNTMKNTMFEHVISFHAEEQEFVSRMEQKWGRAFVASEAMYIMTLRAAEDYSEYADSISSEKAETIKWQYVALRHIHGRALQVFLEIITLMKGGFADSAYARWRTLYELSIVAWFIRDSGEGTAQRYCQAANSEDRYEWAREGLGPQKKKGYIKFRDIEKKGTIDTAQWNDQYIIANRIIHPSPQGTFGRVGDMGKNPVITVGRTDYGAETPGVNSAISLAQITATFFTVLNNEEAIVSLKCITQWIEVVREEYFKAHDGVFPDDVPLWDAEKDIQGKLSD